MPEVLFLPSCADPTPYTLSCVTRCICKGTGFAGILSSTLCAAMQVIGMGIECVAAASAAAGAASRHGPGLLAAFTLTPLAAARRACMGF